MSRKPRCGSSCPTATRAQLLREAKSSAAVRDMEKKQQELAKRQADPFVRRKRVVMPEPKKVDFKKPGMTKAMMARVKQAEKFKQDYERKQQALTSDRRPRRTPAPVGGDARLGKERQPRTPSRPRTPAASPTRIKTPGTCYPTTSKRQAIPKKTNELARMMNADVIQAEPVGEGPISNIVIPPGVVSDNRTTIVSIPQPDAEAPSRSIQVIRETLDEQDAAETAAVQNRLTDLQQARRDFVITAAHLGGSVNMDDIPSSPGAPSQTILPGAHKPSHKMPDVRDDHLRTEYGRDHPHILAAREHIQKAKAEKEAMEAARRMEEEFQRIGATEQLDGLNIDIPFEEELYLDRDISWEEDESGMCMPRPSRVKAFTEEIPIAPRPYQHKPFDPEELERFFDLQRYPPSPSCAPCGPPPGRETLHQDLWELEDPWYIPPPQPDEPDLIEFDLIDFD